MNPLNQLGPNQLRRYKYYLVSVSCVYNDGLNLNPATLSDDYIESSNGGKCGVIKDLVKVCSKFHTYGYATIAYRCEFLDIEPNLNKEICFACETMA